MLDYVARDHQIKLTKIEITIDQRLEKVNLRIRALGDLDATRGCINSGDVVSECSKPAADVTIPATQIANGPHAV